MPKRARKPAMLNATSVETPTRGRMVSGPIYPRTRQAVSRSCKSNWGGKMSTLCWADNPEAQTMGDGNCSSSFAIRGQRRVTRPATKCTFNMGYSTIFVQQLVNSPKTCSTIDSFTNSIIQQLVNSTISNST